MGDCVEIPKCATKDYQCNIMDDCVEIPSRSIEKQQIIGSGQFGRVYRGLWHAKDAKRIAIKEYANNDMFTIEMQHLKRVRHPNIIEFYGVTSHPDLWLIVEHMEGGSLYALLYESRRDYTLHNGLVWIHQCAKAVAYLHATRPPLIHRDLKSANLLLTHDARLLKVCDFGIAADKHTIMTNERGTPAWMAPEVFAPMPYTEKCDTYSLAMVSYEIYMRTLPFAFERYSKYQILMSALNGGRPRRIPGMPKVLENLLEVCWDHNPDMRPTMQQIADLTEIILSIFPKEIPYLTDEKTPRVTDKEIPPVTDEENPPVTEDTEGCYFIDSEFVIEISPLTDKEISPVTDREISPITNEEKPPVPDDEQGLIFIDSEFVIC